jgi:hypothetical protein
MKASVNLASRFERVVLRIVRANDFAIDPASEESADFIGRWHDATWIVEVKYYRTARAQVSLLETAAARLVDFVTQREAGKGMLVVSSVIPGPVRTALEEKYGLAFVDRTDLFLWAERFPETLDELHAILEDDDGPEDARSGRDPNAARFKGMPRRSTTRPITTGADLCRELGGLQRGKKMWRSYESLCERILRYLFPSDLHGWHKQKRTDDGINRYDYVCRIRSAKAFWRFLIENLNSRYVLFEFKNYSARVKQGQVLTTEKYLLERGLRRVAILITRAGADKGATAMIQGAMREHGKLVLVIDDAHVCEMLHMRDRGEDPSDALFDLADEFLLTLPR